MGRIYPSYKFEDHDPILDQIDRLREIAAGQRGIPISNAHIERKSGVTTSTLRNWASRKTKRPQFPTIKAVVRALGGEITLVYNGQEIKRKVGDGRAGS